MPNSTLFGYSLEEQDGKLIITVHGEFATAVVRFLREEFSQGRGLSIIQRLSPLGPLKSLLPQPGSEEEEEEEEGLMDLAEAGRALNSDEILHQGVDQSLEAFNRELAGFRDAMRQYQSSSGQTSASRE
jgi:hypothetical protein